MEKEVYLKIKGRVQGIGFRWWAVKTAEEIGGISGWVHNAADGSVEILMSGEEDNIDRMIGQREFYCRAAVGIFAADCGRCIQKSLKSRAFSAG